MKTRRRYRRKSISKRRKRKSTKKKRRYRRKGTKKKKRRRRRRGGEPKKRTLKRTQPRRGMSGIRGFADPEEVDREMEKVVREFPSGVRNIQRNYAPKLYKKTMGDARDTAIRHVLEKEKNDE